METQVFKKLNSLKRYIIIKLFGEIVKARKGSYMPFLPEFWQVKVMLTKVEEIEMYSILLVEDEELELETLREYIDWRSLECDPVYAARSGRRALEIIWEHKPDIVITDIQMPGMTGLELAERIREMGGQQKIVFLTGYDRYDYVKKAMTVEAADYILKPFTEESIGEVISQVKEKIRKEQWMHLSVISAQKMMLERLCCHQDGYMEAYTWMQRFSEEETLEKQFHVIAVYGNFTREQYQRLIRENKVILHCIVFERVTVYLLRKFVSSRDMAVRIQNYFREYCAVECNIIYLKDVVPLECLYENCQELQNLFQVMFYCDIRLWELEEARAFGDQVAREQKPHFIKGGGIAQIQHVLLHNSRDEVVKALDSYLDTLSYQEYDQAIFYSMELCKAVEEQYSLQKIGNLEGELKEIECSIVRSCHFGEVRSALRRLLYPLTEQSGESRKDQTADVMVGYARQYISENYRKPVLVEELARNAGISTNYFRTIFKERTGVTIYEYTTQIRMEKAKELLRDERQKVKEIGVLVGYESSAHFGSVFRKRFGMTPNEYRRKIQEGRNTVQKHYEEDI